MSISTRCLIAKFYINIEFFILKYVVIFKEKLKCQVIQMLKSLNRGINSVSFITKEKKMTKENKMTKESFPGKVVFILEFKRLINSQN